MATGTLSPTPWQTFLDATGTPYASAKLFTYAAGTTTKATTYTDVGLLSANTNPIILDAAGRATIFLAPGVAYKFVLAPANDTDPPLAPIKTQDNVNAVPASNIDVDVTGTAGEALSAGDVAYLSDGSGALTAGRWYKADADLAYASTAAGMVGMAVAAIASGASGAFRVTGRFTGLAGLTVGSLYYVSSTAGAVTATAPNNPRFLGVADSTTTLLLASNPIRRPGDASVCQGRLTLTSATPVTSSGVSGATSAYFTPYTGNQIALYDGAQWNLCTFSELTIALAGLTASTPYDVFAYDNAGTVSTELVAWTNTTTRATAITLQNGVYVKSGATTRRYLGSIYINASGGQTDDTVLKRYVFNYTNRTIRDLLAVDTTDTWAYSTNTIRQANANAANQVEVMVGVPEQAIALQVIAHVRDSAQENLFAGIGEDSTTAKATGMIGGQIASGTANLIYQINASLVKVPAVGWHRYTWLESNLTGGGTSTWLGDNGGTGLQSGLTGTWRC